MTDIHTYKHELTTHTISSLALRRSPIKPMECQLDSQSGRILKVQISKVPIITVMTLWGIWCTENGTSTLLPILCMASKGPQQHAGASLPLSCMVDFLL